MSLADVSSCLAPAPSANVCEAPRANVPGGANVPGDLRASALRREWTKVASGSYLCRMRSVGLKILKNRLSE